MLHGWQPSIAIIGRGCTVQRDVLGIHRHPQHRHVVLPADHRADASVGTVDDRQCRAVTESPDHPLHCSRHELPVLAEQHPIRTEEQHRAVERSEFALDDANHHVAGVRGRRLAEALRLRTGHVDRGVEVEPELFTAGRVALANDKTVVDSFRVAGNEGFREENHLRTLRRGFSDQADRLVDAAFGIEGHGAGLYNRNVDALFQSGRSHCGPLLEVLTLADRWAHRSAQRHGG